MKREILFGIILFTIGARVSAQNTFPATGNAGIGTLTPAHTLEVNGDTQIATTVITNSNAPFPNSSILFSQPGFNNMFGVDGLWTTKYFGMKTDGNFLVMGGNVGIGTANPDNAQNWQKVLELHGDIHAKMLVTSSTIKTGIFSDQTWGSQIMGRVGTESSHDLGLMAGYGNIVMTLKTTGNVGIGINNPAEKLAVNGNIRAKEVKVETANWPDYVFEKGYKITSLSDLEEYIKINGHLPEVPDSKDAEKNGVALGDMNKLLLKKVEELTLHLIEKEKQMNMIKFNIEKIQEDSNKISVANDKRVKELEELVFNLIKKSK